MKTVKHITLVAVLIEQQMLVSNSKLHVEDIPVQLLQVVIKLQ
jgi:hypothetical protein